MQGAGDLVGDETIEHLQESGFTRAGRSGEYDELPGGDLDANILQGWIIRLPVCK